MRPIVCLFQVKIMFFTMVYIYSCGHRSKNHESGKKPKTVVSCQDCDKTFTRKSSLMRHAREVHNKYDASSHARECGACPICKESLQNYSAVVIKHLKIVHSISVEVEEKLFPSLEGMICLKRIACNI